MRLALVHGFTQTGRSWEPVQRLLEAAGHEVVCPDLPGHGTSDAERCDLAGAADGLATRVGSAVWVGYSLGGRVCLHLALRHPEVVEGLVLASTTAGIDDPAERQARRAADDALADDVERMGVPAFVDRWLSAPMWSTLLRERAGIPERLRNTSSGLASSLRLAGTGTQEPLWARLGELSMPVLVVTGDADAKFTELGDRLCQSIGARASRVQMATGHGGPWENPEGFAGALLRWLAV